MEDDGFICYKCNANIGVDHNDAISHPCMESVSEIYVVDGMVYPFNPKEMLESQNVRWSPDLITTLLDLRLTRNDEFRTPTCKKRKIWMDIADEFKTATGLEISCEACDIKYRNLLATYRMNKKKKLRDPNFPVTWEYYHKMDAILGKRAMLKKRPRETLEDILNQVDSPEDQALRFRWTPSIISLLLDLRLSRELEFTRPGCKKKKLWMSIAQEMKEIGNVDLSYEVCDIKYRNLLATYRVNKKRQIEYKDVPITWEFFAKFDEALGYKWKEMFGNDMSQSDIKAEALEASSSSEGFTARKKKFKLNSFGDAWLDYMRKKDEEKCKRREEMWEEKKKLKEKQIEAIFALAKAVSSLKNSSGLSALQHNK